MGRSEREETEGRAREETEGRMGTEYKGNGGLKWTFTTASSPFSFSSRHFFCLLRLEFQHHTGFRPLLKSYLVVGLSETTQE